MLREQESNLERVKVLQEQNEIYESQMEDLGVRLEQQVQTVKSLQAEKQSLLAEFQSKAHEQLL